MMSEGDAGFARINKAEYLFLRSLRDIAVARLEIIVAEAMVNEHRRGKIAPAQLPESLEFLLEGAAPIESVPGCLAFRLYWKRYAAYLVTEECVGSCGRYVDEVFEGK